jgi:hypothetical protein
MSGDGRVTFKLYLEEDEVNTITVPEGTTVAQMKKIKDRLIGSGVCDEVQINGAPSTGDQLAAIVSDLNASGIAIRIDGAPASDATEIRHGSLVTGAREQKGGHRYAVVC